MTVIIELSPQAEAKLRAKALERGVGLEVFLSDLATGWASQQIEMGSLEAVRAKSAEQRIADWAAFVASHDYITAVADDSRESMYEGCGE